jgi:hypothetical protein
MNNRLCPELASGLSLQSRALQISGVPLGVDVVTEERVESLLVLF